MSNELATANHAEPPATSNEATAIIQVIERAAMNPDVDIDKMERLLQMQERVLDRQAAADYNAAMAAMQTDIPSIAERGRTNNGRYATLEDIVDTVRPIMQRHGFAVSFRVNTLDRGVEVTGVLMHRGGHREETTMLLPADTSGNKNAVQAFGSSVSYGKRYVLCSLLNITTRNSDDDGFAAAPFKRVTALQAKSISSTLGECSQATNDWFASQYESAEDVPRAEFDRLIARLRSAAEKAAQAE